MKLAEQLIDRRLCERDDDDIDFDAPVLSPDEYYQDIDYAIDDIRELKRVLNDPHAPAKAKKISSELIPLIQKIVDLEKQRRPIFKKVMALTSKLDAIGG